MECFPATPGASLKCIKQRFFVNSLGLARMYRSMATGKGVTLNAFDTTALAGTHFSPPIAEFGRVLGVRHLLS